MKMERIFIVLLACLLAGCVHYTRPAALQPLAAQFKAKAGLNRIAEGRKVAGLLPVCPVVHGRPWLLGFDESVPVGAPDMGHPSYILSQEDFLEAMGKPDRSQPEDLRHGIWAGASYDLGSDRNNTAWELLVTFYDHRVVTGCVIKRFTPSIIRTRTNPDGSTTSVTNYLL
jgi:hypothetical protein